MRYPILAGTCTTKFSSNSSLKIIRKKNLDSSLISNAMFLTYPNCTWVCWPWAAPPSPSSSSRRPSWACAGRPWSPGTSRRWARGGGTGCPSRSRGSGSWRGCPSGRASGSVAHEETLKEEKNLSLAASEQFQRDDTAGKLSFMVYSPNINTNIPWSHFKHFCGFDLYSEQTFSKSLGTSRNRIQALANCTSPLLR